MEDTKQQYDTEKVAKKPYVTPEMEAIEVKVSPILTGSSYPTDGDGFDGWYD